MTWINSDNLRGIPSIPFRPVFAQRFRHVVDTFQPDCIAVALPEMALNELRWAVEQWPVPCASLSEHTIFSFVPGDSLFEAAKFAGEQNCRLEAVDLAPLHLSSSTPQSFSFPDPEWFSQLGADCSLWEQAVETILLPPTTLDILRENHMAARVHALLMQGHRVLWVGGAMHWKRLRQRIVNSNFTPTIHSSPASITFQRAQIEPLALLYLTGCSPVMVSRYAENPANYNFSQATQELLIQALADSQIQHNALLPENVAHSPLVDFDDLLSQTEDAAPKDAAQVFSYARNIAASTNLRSTPDVAELIQAASAVIGPLYAGRLYTLLTEPMATHSTLRLPTLSLKLQERSIELLIDDNVIDARPYWPTVTFNIKTLRPEPPTLNINHPLLSIDKKSSGDGDNSDRVEQYSWMCLPSDHKSYTQFVQYVFRIVSQRLAQENEHVVSPFYSGLAEGIDVRATLRSIHNDEIWVRENGYASHNITNAIIDWQNESEFCEHLQGNAQGINPGGWADPSEFFNFGSCSRETMKESVLSQDPFVSLQRREWTMLTLDLGTTERQRGGDSFYQKVIGPLLDLVAETPHKNNVYHWLNIMCRFCAGKPLAYFSHYRPSAKLLSVAARHQVHIHHIPLNSIPLTIRVLNQFFRFTHVPLDYYRNFMLQELKRQLRIEK